MALNLPSLPEVEKVSTSVIRILGGNPSKFTLQGSNTYLLGTGSERILLDTGEGRASWISALTSLLSSENCQIQTCLLSHWHHDHIGGVDDLSSLSPTTPLHKHQPSYDPQSKLSAHTLESIDLDQHFSLPCGFEIRALHTPGHTRDHMCFVITASPDPTEIGNIFTADNVLGHGTAVFEDLAAYLSSLQTMQSALPSDGPVKAYPGHGALIPDARAKIAEYIEHRHMREQEALNVLKYGTPAPPPSIKLDKEGDSVGAREVVTGKEWGSMEMVKVIYRHYPENLWEPAEYGLLMVLEKLRGEGRVEKGQQGGWVVVEKAAL